MYALGFIFVYAFYIFQLRIYRFIKEERQKGIIAVTCLAAVIIACSNILLIPVWGMEGALLSGVIAEWIMVIIYFYMDYFKKDKRQVVSSRAG